MTPENRNQNPPAFVDLGDEDPLLFRDVRGGPPDRRRLSYRWLAGSVLTGLFSAVLVGGALQAAVRPGDDIVIRPSFEFNTSVGPPQESAAAKSDRIQPVAQAEMIRKVIQVSTITRMNDRDLVKVKPFAHVKSGLTLAEAEEFQDDVPPFNPLRLFSDNGEVEEVGNSESIYAAEVDGEVTIKVDHFPVDGLIIAETALLSDTEAEFEVHAASPILDEGVVHVASLNPVDLARFETIEIEAGAATPLALAVPENVSFVEKSGAMPADIRAEEREITVARGDALGDLLTANGANASEAAMIQSAMIRNFSFDFRARQKLKLGMSVDDNGRARPVRVSLYSGSDHLATVALSDSGIYVPANAPTARSDETEQRLPTQVSRSGKLPSVFTGIWRTALALNMPRPLIEDLIRVFALDVDYQSRLTSSDNLEVLYSIDENGEEQAGEVLYASLTLAGTERRFYRFRTPDDGVIDYYDETGKSAKKFLMRKPMASGRFRSPFGMRKHPILGRYKMHTGVDWAAPRKTPIMASGHGRGSDAKWKSGYGKHVKIQHANGYMTTYSHMTAYGKGIREGVRVRQGQIIGYVGSTGLSTGPHLHYEVLVNKRFVNPMKIRLPRGRILQGGVLAKFNSERDRIIALLEKDKPARIADTQL